MVLASFVCPITHEVFQDPVMTCDNHTYERRAIRKWFRKNHTSPLTGKVLKTKRLVPNTKLRDLIETHYNEVKKRLFEESEQKSFMATAVHRFQQDHATDVDSRIQLGLILLEGYEGVIEQDVHKAFELLQSAHTSVTGTTTRRAAVALLLNALGRCHYEGLGTEKNLEKGVLHYHQAATAENDPEAQFALGKHFVEMSAERDQGLAFFRMAAEQGHTASQIQLSKHLLATTKEDENGSNNDSHKDSHKDSNKDDCGEEARMWLNKVIAAEAEESDEKGTALKMLGMMLLRSDKSETEKEEGAKLLMQAAEQYDDEDAQFMVGKILLGQNREKEAQGWLMRAASKSNHGGAQALLNLMKQNHDLRIEAVIY